VIRRVRNVRSAGGNIESSDPASVFWEEVNGISMHEQTIVVVGVGLIGGSIAAAVRAIHPEIRVVGVGRNPDRLQEALQHGLITDWVQEISAASIPEGSLGVVCLPVDQIPQTVVALLRAGCGAVTDAGSTKQAICDQLSAESRFVGAHPIAGSEQAGFEHADAGLFRGRVCVLCPTGASPDALQRVVEFWSSLGLTLKLLEPAEHDRILALTSHLPHVLAAVAAGVVTEEQLEFTGSGFRDTTRIAAGSADVWTSILIQNSDACVAAIAEAAGLLERFRQAISAGDGVALRALWETSAERRRKL
jgi:prephenate dehydrogenase